MFSKIANVFFSKILVSVLGFFIVIINAKQLGAEGLGLISLIILCITYNQVVCGIVGGSALMYLAPRKPLLQLLLPSYFWGILSSLAGAAILVFCKLLPPEYARDVFLLSVLQAFGTVHLNLFIGLEKIRKYNWISALQVIISFVSLLLLFYLLKEKNVRSYITSLYLGYAFVFLASTFVLLPEIKTESMRSWGNSLKAIVQNSVYIQVATIIHLLNCRLSYFMLDKYMDNASLGIFSTAVSIAESLWLINRSIAVVQYSKVVNSTEPADSRELTLVLAKFSLVLTLFFAGVMLLIPGSFYMQLFGEKFEILRHLLIYLLPGIVFVANATLYVHYFAAIGKNGINTLASAVGFTFTLLFCLVLIPRYQMAGAAVSSSASYFATTLFLIFNFKKETGYSWKRFLINRSDTRYIFVEIKKLFAFN